MAKNPSFSIQLDDIPNPQDYSKAGALVQSAGELRGQATYNEAKANANFLTGMASQAAQAVVGYAEQDIESKTKKALDEYEDNPTHEVGREAAAVIDNLDARERERQGPGERPGDDPAVAEMRAQASQFRLAESQGLFSKKETITRIADVVKQWSARLPGLQSEFRKVAANETGISNIDTHLIHQALTTESNREKAAASAAKQMEKYLERVSVWMGIPPDQITRQDASKFAAFVQFEQNTKRSELEAKNLSLNDETKTRALDPLVMNRTAGDLMRLSGLFATMDQLNKEPGKAKERDQLQIQLTSEIQRMYRDTSTYITLQGAQNGLGNAIISQRLADVKKTYDSMAEQVKTQAGMDSLKLAIGRREDEAKDVIRRFEVANPTLSILTHQRVSDKLFDLWQAKGTEGLVRDGMPRDMAESWDNAFKNMKDWAPSFARATDPEAVRRHGQVDFRGAEGAHYDANKQKATLTFWQGGWSQALADPTSTAEQQTKGMVGLHGWTMNTQPNDSRQIRELNAMMAKPGTDAFLQGRTDVERRIVAEPIFKHFPDAIRGQVAAMRDGVTAINSAGDNRAIAAGWQVEAVQGADGKVGLQWKMVQEDAVLTPPGGFAETPAGAVTGVRTSGLPQTAGPAFMGPDANMRVANLQKQVDVLNSWTETLANGWRIRGGEGVLSKEEIRASAIQGIGAGGTMEALSPQEVFEKIEVEKRAEANKERLTQMPIDKQQVEFALRDAEDSYTKAGKGRSPAGAEGIFQITHWAAKAVLKNEYDQNKLAEYQKDEAMSRRIGMGFYEILLDKYKDPVAAAAAYNWGGENQEKIGAALKWAKETGKDWREYPPIPAETKKYIKLFSNSYATYIPGARDTRTGKWKPRPQ